MAVVRIVAEMPDARLEEFLQMLRAWDDAKTDRHMQIGVEAPGFTAAEMSEMFKRLAPMFENVWYMPVPKNVGSN